MDRHPPRARGSAHEVKNKYGSRVESSRDRRCSEYHESGRVGSGRVGSGQEGSKYDGHVGDDPADSIRSSRSDLTRAMKRYIFALLSVIL